MFGKLATENILSAFLLLPVQEKEQKQLRPIARLERSLVLVSLVSVLAMLSLIAIIPANIR